MVKITAITCRYPHLTTPPTHPTYFLFIISEIIPEFYNLIKFTLVLFCHWKSPLPISMHLLRYLGHLCSACLYGLAIWYTVRDLRLKFPLLTFTYNTVHTYKWRSVSKSQRLCLYLLHVLKYDWFLLSLVYPSIKQFFYRVFIIRVMCAILYTGHGKWCMGL